MIAVCSRCSELFETTEEYANMPGRICGNCADELRAVDDQDALAELAYQQYLANPSTEIHTDLF